MATHDLLDENQNESNHSNHLQRSPIHDQYKDISVVELEEEMKNSNSDHQQQELGEEEASSFPPNNNNMDEQDNNFKSYESPSDLRKRKAKAILFYWLRVLSGPVLALPFFCNMLTPLGATIAINRCAGITIWIATYWITEPVPIAITSLLPVILFPLLGVTSAKIITEAYFSELSFLFVGSFMVTIALERWNLHRRFSLFVLGLIGMRPFLILLGFMLLGGTLSMFLSNSATTAMLLPMANAVVSSIKKKNNENPNIEKREKELVKIQKFAKTLFLCIPYASSIMGMSTLIGTPTNLIFVHVLNEKFPALQTSDDDPVTFATWFLYAFPLSLTFLVLVYIYFSILFVRPISLNHESTNTVEENTGLNNYSPSNYRSTANLLEEDKLNEEVSPRQEEVAVAPSSKKPSNIFREQYKALGRIRYEEILLTIIFLVMCLLWVSRDIQIGSNLHIGWNNLVYWISGRPEKEKSSLLKYVGDGTVAVLLGSLLFFIPSFNPPSEKDQHNNDTNSQQIQSTTTSRNSHTPFTTGRILEWKQVKNEMPWDIILLLGCGFSLAAAYNQCKFSDFIVDVIVVKLDLASKIHPYLMMLVICFAVNVITEFSSNVGTASLLMPLLATLSIRVGQNPILYMAPATLACSLAFMTPIGTVPNSLAFGYGHFKLTDMVMSGVVLSLLGVASAVLGTMALGGVLGVHLDQVPSWANSTLTATTTTVFP
ncbi:hypothetical protein C9374_004913 [Naegleria lovaniensis]|uniref:Uncharacterized protein n=1 Tax=Naegleria lovaniensis TaxID=51637 RepID=A0AA88GPK8_NAELO|nr:uncharacterized protein C9374_004913 [Naegleria lovaniensis]KAG2382946.1 hypothetical protein C9374_004913 [Naegleria lovaniensis]